VFFSVPVAAVTRSPDCVRVALLLRLALVPPSGRAALLLCGTCCGGSITVAFAGGWVTVAPVELWTYAAPLLVQEFRGGYSWPIEVSGLYRANKQR
jgi:hypothetical protein